MVNDGTLQVSEGSTTVYFGSVSGNSFTGSGTTFVEGDLSPGSSPGSMSFGGDVVLDSSSTTQIELAGTATGEYDQLLVSGVLEVSGTLEVELLDGFQPHTGDIFDILQFGTFLGEFSTVQFPELSDDLLWDSSDLYNRGTLSVIPELAALKGDLDVDGSVDIVDFGIFAAFFGQPDTVADLDGSGMVDILDFGLLADNSGKDLTAGQSPVPEPGGVAVLVVGWLLGVRRPRLKQ